MTLTTSKIQRWLVKWQRVLKLQDWEIAVVVRPREDMEGNDGSCMSMVGRKHASIQLAEAWKPEELNEFYDPEQTFIHELIHVHFAPFESSINGSPEDIAQEQAIDSLATALITQERKIEALKAKLKDIAATAKHQGSRKR